MNKKYYIDKNAQPNGDHEVHTEKCSFLPDEQNREFLGNFSSCQKAVKEARNHYFSVDGCFFCCIECHTS